MSGVRRASAGPSVRPADGRSRANAYSGYPGLQPA